MLSTFVFPSHVTLLLLVVTWYLLLFHLSFCYFVKTPLLLGGIYLSLVIFQAAQIEHGQWDRKVNRPTKNSTTRQQQLDYREKLLEIKEKELEEKYNQLEKSLLEKMSLLKTRLEENSNFKSPLLNKPEQVKLVDDDKSTFLKESEIKRKDRKATKPSWLKRRLFHKKTI